MATMPMMSYLQSSPFASLYGFQPPAAQAGAGLLQQGQPSFQIAPGTQMSSDPGSTANWTRRMMQNDPRSRFRARKQAGAPDQYLTPQLAMLQSPADRLKGR
jgi:hypothetical protein